MFFCIQCGIINNDCWCNTCRTEQKQNAQKKLKMFWFPIEHSCRYDPYTLILVNKGKININTLNPRFREQKNMTHSQHTAVHISRVSFPKYVGYPPTSLVAAEIDYHDDRAFSISVYCSHGRIIDTILSMFIKNFPTVLSTIICDYNKILLFELSCSFLGERISVEQMNDQLISIGKYVSSSVRYFLKNACQ